MLRGQESVWLHLTLAAGTENAHQDMTHRGAAWVCLEGYEWKEGIWPTVKGRLYSHLLVLLLDRRPAAPEVLSTCKAVSTVVASHSKPLVLRELTGLSFAGAFWTGGPVQSAIHFLWTSSILFDWVMQPRRYQWSRKMGMIICTILLIRTGLAKAEFVILNQAWIPVLQARKPMEADKADCFPDH